jgi:MurNAc alpha-1-phosphate uridylyltransferase
MAWSAAKRIPIHQKSASARRRRERKPVLDIATVPVALLAGGLATRLRPITEKIPKALVEISGKPFIDHQLALLHRNGIRRVVMCLGYRGEMVEAHCGDGSRYGMDLKYSYDGEKLLGTGGAIKQAAHLLDEVLWVMYGDSYMDIDYPAVLDFFSRSGAQGLMTVLRNGNRWDKSNVEFRNGKLEKYDKRNVSPEMDYIDYGVALLRRDALEAIPENEPFDLAELYTRMVSERRMVGYEVANRFYEIGTPAALEEARMYLAAQDAGC